MAAVKKDGKAGYINMAGENIIPFEYDNAYDFSDGIALVEKGGRLGILLLTSIPPTPPVSTVGGRAEDHQRNGRWQLLSQLHPYPWADCHPPLSRYGAVNSDDFCHSDSM